MTEQVDEPVIEHSDTKKVTGVLKEEESEQPTPRMELNASRQLTSWMYEQRASFVFTTHYYGRLFFVGLNPEGKLAVLHRAFNRPMGLCMTPDTQTFYLADSCLCWRFENALEAGKAYGENDRYYVPQMGYTTGELNIHDLGVDAHGQPVFVNTLFSCLATVSPTHSFKTLWKPAFITQLMPEDRCHLSGVAMDEGAPRYVTAWSQTDVARGWEDKCNEGGVIIDVEKNKVVVEGLSMPHSPRIHEGKLWLINSGTGYLGYVEFKDEEKTQGEFKPFAFCLGYATGLSFINHFAVVSVSKNKAGDELEGFPLPAELAKRKAKSKCALLIIDLNSGDVVHSLQVEGNIETVFDVLALPNTLNPTGLSFRSEEIRRVITISEP